MRTLGRLQEWNDRNVFPTLLGQLYEILGDQGLLGFREAFQGGTSSAANKGTQMSAPVGGQRGTVVWTARKR